MRSFAFGNWKLDTTTRTLTDLEGKEVALSGAEYRLLAVLLSSANRVLSRAQLTELLRGREADPFDRSIDVRVSRLRQILGDDARAPQIIKTVYGEGYVVGVPVQTHELTAEIRALWPQSLFGRLIAASIIALLLAQVVSLVMIARERERFILQGSVREWSRRIAEVTTVLQGMDDTERSAMISRLNERPWRFGHRPPDAFMFRDGLGNGPDGIRRLPRSGRPRRPGHDGPQGDTGAPQASRQRRTTPVPHWRRRCPARRGSSRPGAPTGGAAIPRRLREPTSAGDGPPAEDTRSLVLRATTYPAVVPFTKAGDFEPAFEEQLRKIWVPALKPR